MPLRPLPLAIDFAGRRPASRLGIALLVTGLAIAAAVAVDITEMEARATAASQRVDQLRKSLRRQSAIRPANAVDRDEAKAAQRVADAVRTPWDALLRELATAQTDDVALLGLDAEAASRALRLAGEAKNADQAFAYATRLRQSPWFEDVTIVSHEDKLAGTVPIFAFTLSATWKAPS